MKHCRWVKSFRESEAGDLGHAMVCSAGLAISAAFNPKLRPTREKSLMQGQERCHFRYTMEGSGTQGVPGRSFLRNLVASNRLPTKI